MNKNISLGLKIKSFREELNLSQSEVVEKITEQGINMSRETLSKIENGNRTVSAVEFNALCNVLYIDINSLFEEYEEDDLVTLFRKRNLSEKELEALEELQEMAKIFIYQKKIYYGEFKPQKRNPMWKEC
jgi:transcriptional regulator with XRE-family HTH domain